MRNLIVMAAFCGAMFTGPAVAQSFGDIYGRTLAGDNGTIVINGNGTWGGTFNGTDFTGTWTVRDGRFCGSANGGAERCRDIRMTGNRITFIDGDGNRSRYRIQ